MPRPLDSIWPLVALALWGCSPAPTPVAETRAESPPTSGQAAAEGTPAPGPPRDNPDGVRLRIREAKGTKLTYTWTNDASSRPSNEEWAKKLPEPYNKPGSMNVYGTLTMEVVEVGEGRLTFKTVSKTTGGTGVGHGVEQAKEYIEKPADVQTVRVTDRWAKLDQEEFYDPLINSFNRMFPEQAVGVGDTWTYTPFPQAKAAVATVEKEETVQGIETLKLKIDLPGAFPSSKDTLNVWVDPKKGRIVKIDMLNTQDEQGLFVSNRYVQTLKP